LKRTRAIRQKKRDEKEEQMSMKEKVSRWVDTSQNAAAACARVT